MKAWSSVLCLGLGIVGLPLGAQVALIDDRFGENPFVNGWTRNGDAAWVPPPGEAAVCLDPNVFDPLDPCAIYSLDDLESLGESVEEFGGYVLVTPATVNVSGNFFRTERLRFDSFRLTVVVELRDGPGGGLWGDGICVVLLGSEDPPDRIGTGGGGMGATGLGFVPTMILELDDDRTAADDFGDENHVGFTWSATGFSGNDAPCSPNTTLPGCRKDVMVSLDRSLYPLNGREWPEVPNRFEVDLLVEDGVVACDLRRLDQPHDFGRLFTFAMPGFPEGGFEGYLGFTASTGGGWQNHIVHSVRLETLPEDFSLCPPPSVHRDFRAFRSPDDSSGDYRPLESIPVVLTVGNPIGPPEGCSLPARIVVRETPPAGWALSNISGGGSFDPAPPGTISWVVSAPDLAVGKELSYTVTVPEGARASAAFSGQVLRDGPLVQPIPIQGEEIVFLDTPFALLGYIRSWNILGIYLLSGGSTINPDQDFLTDGMTGERDFVWFPGAQIQSRAALYRDPMGHNQEGVPTVFAWNDPDGLIDLTGEVFGQSPSYVMAYAQIYVHNVTGRDMEVYLDREWFPGQIFLNGEEVMRPGFEADPGPRALILEPGEQSLLVKVFKGEAISFHFSLRFVDEAGRPITEGLRFCKYPLERCDLGPARIVREIHTPDTVVVEGVTRPSWREGATYEVGLDLASVCLGTPSCPPAGGTVTITESVPEGWVPSSPSPGGIVDGRTVSWSLSGAALTPGTLTYQVLAGGTPGDVRFEGTITVPGWHEIFQVSGQSLLFQPLDLSQQGFIRKWLLLGPYELPGLDLIGGAPLEEEMRLDYLTDGAGITETGVTPRAGDTVDTSYYPGPARSLGLAPTAGPVEINPDGVPTWKAWVDLDDTIDFARCYGGDLNAVLMYALTYVTVAVDATVDLGLASDDSIQVLLDGREIHMGRGIRQVGEADTIQDTVRAVTLAAGTHRLMVKVFEGRGGHGFRMRLQDPAGVPVTRGFRLCLDPERGSCDSTLDSFVRGDMDSSGIINLSDGIGSLNFLFSGSAEPACMDAADTDDSGDLTITDAIGIFNWLFLGAGPPRPPAPGQPDYTVGDCGLDPGPVDSLGCASPAATCN